jgi:hypothetical protein
MNKTRHEDYLFTEEQINNFAGLYNALKKVRDRLLREGYTIKNNQISQPKNNKHLEI